MADQLPPPPVPADADLTHYDNMPLEVRRLRDSDIAGSADAEVFRCAVLLWCAAWHQVPAGSLPKDDEALCRLVGLGRDLRTWKKIKAGVLRGWREFADGRIYHRVVAEKVIDSWNSTRLNRWAKECDRIRKENKARKEKKEIPLDFPERPAAIPSEWPAVSGGIPTENGLNRMEGNGCLERAPTGLSRKPKDQTSPPEAARESAEGAHTHDAIARIAKSKRMP